MIEARSATCIVYSRTEAEPGAAAAVVVDGAVVVAAVPSSGSYYFNYPICLPRIERASVGVSEKKGPSPKQDACIDKDA